MIVLSGTRCVLLGILVAVFIVATMMLMGRAPAAAMGKRRVWAGMLAVLLALCVTAGVYLVQLGYGRALQSASASLNAQSVEDMRNADQSARNSLIRKDMSGNISSNRFAIWADYIHVLLDRPEKLILGYSPCGYMPYIREHYRDLFIVQYFREKYAMYYFKKHEVYATHNSVLAVLISTGFAGLGLLAALAVKMLKQICLYYRQGRFRALDYCVFAMLITAVTAMMFETDVFYQCNITSVLFWMTTGFMRGRYRTDGQRSPVEGLR